MDKINIPNKHGEIITTTCSYDCGARCLLKVHVKDGRIFRITTEKIKGLNITACPRGLLQKEVVYDKNRLTHPMKRIGERSAGRFEIISWDEALQTVAEQIKKTIKLYGTESIYFLVNTGSLSALHNTRAATKRFFGLLGKCTTAWGNVSFEGALQSSLATFGTPFTGSTRDNLLYSKLIILWGWNPLVSRFGPDTAYYLSMARKARTRIICVDPRKSRSCAILADEWIAIKPGTDAAMLIAMAHVMLQEKLYDKNFIEKYTFGFDKFCDYINGREGGLAKSPQWAESICGVPAKVIARLAREYASIKPAALLTGWSPGRSAFGEQFHRAASTLAAMTGNIGIKGSFVSGGAGLIDLGMFKDSIPVPQTSHNMIHKTDLYDALLYGKSKNYPSDCKLLYITGCNLLNQYLNLNKGRKALLCPEFIVVHDLFFTPTAKYADIILPVTHFFENEDIGQPWLGGPYLIYMNKVIDAPPGHPKSDFQIFSELARELQINNYNDKTDEGWLGFLLEREPGFPDLSTLRKEGIFHFENNHSKIAFKEQIENIEDNPFPTPSGRIEIFSNKFAEINNPLIPPIPKYIPPWEGPEDKLTKDFPIQLISPHSRARVNSQFYNIKKFKKLKDDALWMNPEDALTRGIEDGDKVYVFNERGRICTKVKVTNAIMPGVASIDQGQWYDPDSNGIDFGSCINVLTRDEKSPVGAFASNTCLVQIEKA